MRGAFLCVVLLAQAVALVSCSGGGATTMTFEEFQKKVQVLNGEAQGRAAVGLTVARVKEYLGPPFKQQMLNERWYFYYRVREGTVQIEVVPAGPGPYSDRTLLQGIAEVNLF